MESSELLGHRFALTGTRASAAGAPAGRTARPSQRPWGSISVDLKHQERLEEAGIENSAGSVGDSYDNALSETIIEFFKTEIIGPLGPWRSSSAVEITPFEWVDWYNKRRLFSSIDYKTPMEFEQVYYLNQAAPARPEKLA